MLPLIFTLALDGLAAIPPAGTYRYSASIDRKSVGGTTVTLSTTPQGYKLVEDSGSHMSTGDTYTHSTMLLDPQLIPTSYTSSYKVGDDRMQAAVVFAPRAALVTVGPDQKTFQLGGSSKTFAILDASMMSGFLMLPAQMRAFKDADLTVLVPGLGTNTFLSVLHDVTPQRPDGLPPADVSLSFAGETPLVEWYDPASLIVDEVEVPRQDLRIVRRR